MFRSIPRAYVNIKVRINLSNDLLSSRDVMSSSLFRRFSYLSRNSNGSFRICPRTRINIEKRGLFLFNRDTESFVFYYSHNFWLRDHCRCEECFHEVTKQRLVDTFKIPEDIKSLSASPELHGIKITCMFISILVFHYPSMENPENK